mgnify:CR=1 FL=1
MKNLEKDLEKEIEIESLATFVHGALFSLHCLGLYAALRNKKYTPSFIHGTFLIYESIAMLRHNKNRQVYIGEGEMFI